MLTGLTHKESECLTAIDRLTVDGVAPSFAELQAELGLASKQGVHRLIHALKDRGAITFLPNRRRSVRLLPTRIGPSELMALTDPELRTTAAHIAGILAHREGGSGQETAAAFRRIADRIERAPHHPGSVG